MTAEPEPDIIIITGDDFMGGQAYEEEITFPEEQSDSGSDLLKSAIRRYELERTEESS